MTFDYLRTVTSLDYIEIPDIGNVCLCAYNDDGQEWYILISTKEGWTEIKEFGPLFNNHTVTYFNYNKFAREYSDKKNSKVINDFINNTRREITQVLEIEEDEFIEKFNSIKNEL